MSAENGGTMVYEPQLQSRGRLLTTCVAFGTLLGVGSAYDISENVKNKEEVFIETQADLPRPTVEEIRAARQTIASSDGPTQAISQEVNTKLFDAIDVQARESRFQEVVGERLEKNKLRAEIDVGFLAIGILTLFGAGLEWTKRR